MTTRVSIRASMVRDGAARLLTMRVRRSATNDDLILRSRESGVSKDGPRNDCRHASTSSRRIPPELCFNHHPLQVRGRREDRVAAAPGALAQEKIARARKPRVQAVTTGLPCAVVYGLYALSSVNHPVCHRHRRDAIRIVANLAPDLGAPGPHDFAVRLRGARQQPHKRPPPPRLTSRDDREPSLC
jgi:hypothetical protein